MFALLFDKKSFLVHISRNNVNEIKKKLHYDSVDEIRVRLPIEEEVQVYTWYVLIENKKQQKNYQKSVRFFVNRSSSNRCCFVFLRMDATLREVTDLVRQAHPAARRLDLRFQFSSLYPGMFCERAKREFSLSINQPASLRIKDKIGRYHLRKLGMNGRMKKKNLRMFVVIDQ